MLSTEPSLLAQALLRCPELLPAPETQEEQNLNRGSGTISLRSPVASGSTSRRGGVGRVSPRVVRGLGSSWLWSPSLYNHSMPVVPLAPTHY